MADIVVETGAGLSSATSYCSEDDADSYHENRLHSTVWTGASSDDKEAALVWATRLLDEQVVWNGFKKTSAQALAWPRSYVYDREGYLVSSSIVPTAVKNATAELARYLISSDRTSETNADLAGFKSLKVGPLEMTLDKSSKLPTIPKSVWSMISVYGISMRRRKKTLVRM